MDINYDFETAAIILTGYTGYSPDLKIVQEYRNKILELAVNNPIMGATMAAGLIDCLEVRNERRSK